MAPAATARGNSHAWLILHELHDPLAGLGRTLMDTVGRFSDLVAALAHHLAGALHCPAGGIDGDGGSVAHRSDRLIGGVAHRFGRGGDRSS